VYKKARVLQDRDFVFTQYVGDKLEKGEWWYYRYIIPLTRLLARLVNTEKEPWHYLGMKIKENVYDQPDSIVRTWKENAREAKALHAAYNYDEIGTKNSLDRFWAQRFLNARAVRNRLKIVKHLLKKQIKRRLKAGQDTVTVLSLASGTGQAEIEAVDELLHSDRNGVDVSTSQVEAVLVDMKNWPLGRARDKAKKKGVDNCFQFERRIIVHSMESGREPNIVNTLSEFGPDIVQLIGFQDYLNDNEVKEFMDRVYSGLSQGSTFLTCNIAPNPEQHALPGLLDWDITHRSLSKQVNLALSSEFSGVNLYTGPTKIYGILEMHKPQPR